MIQQPLQRSTPEEQGVASAALLDFVAALDDQIHDMHSLLLLRHGQVIAEGWWQPYAPEYRHKLFSLSKSFASTAIGLAVAEGRLTIEDRVISFFPAETPVMVSENLAAMRVRDLLMMATGHEEDATGPMREQGGENWVKGFLALPVQRTPGTYFVYNSAATYMLSAIIQKLTGQKLLDYLQPRLLEPLGITDAFWESCPLGIHVGGWGLNIKTEDIAKFGQLYLQQGQWCGQQLVSAAWVAEATAAQIDNSVTQTNPDWSQGYGYQFWRCRHGGYRGDGAFGQFCIVLPAQDAVLALTAGVANMQAVLDLMWEKLLPALGDKPLATAKAAQTQLEQKLAGLALSPVQGEPTSPWAGRVNGHYYQFAANEYQVETLALDFAGESCTVRMRHDGGEHLAACDYGAWRFGRTTLDAQEEWKVAASGAWTAPDTYTAKLLFYETPFSSTMVCRFVDDRVLFDSELNVSFGPTKRNQLVGTRVG